MKTVRDVMTEGVEVISPNDTIKAAAEKMRQFNIGPVPVCDGERLVGIVTDRDLVVRGIAMGRDPNNSKVSEVMSEDIECINAGAGIDQALEMMRNNQIRRLLVLDDNKNLVGIVSLGDIAAEASAKEAGRALEDISVPAEPSRP